MTAELDLLGSQVKEIEAAILAWHKGNEASRRLATATAKTWRRLQGENQLRKVVQGVTFRNGVEATDTPARSAA